MSAQTTPVDTLLSPFKPATNDAARKAENKIFVINRDSANNRAEKQHYGVVGVVAHDKTGAVKENTANTNIRYIQKAFEDIWTEPSYKDKTEDGGSKYKLFVQGKKGPGVVFVASIPLNDFVTAFPNHFGPVADPDNEGKSVNIYLASQLEDVVKALRISHFIPGNASDAAANQFVRNHSFSLQEVARVINGVDNPAFNEAKRAAFDALVNAAEAAKKASEKPKPQGINVDLFLGASEVASNIGSNPYTKAASVDVLDVNGSRVCCVGEEPSKNIKNIVSDALDNLTPVSRAETFAKKTMKVSGLVAVGSGGYAFVPRPTEPATTATKSKHFPLNLSVTYHDEKGVAYPLPIDFFRSDNARAAGILVGELKAAKRDGSMIYTVDPSAADAAVIAIAKREEEARTKTVKTKAEPRVAKNIFATKK